jgi:hypothetical protein
MNKIKFKNWVFDIDPLSTKNVYENIKNGGSDNCSCSYCKNYRIQKDKAFPQEILTLFEKLGIDYRKEVEVPQLCKTKDGLHQYDGWFHFIGKIKRGNKLINILNNIRNVFGKQKVLHYQSITNDFSILFTEGKELVNHLFKDYPTVQLEYVTNLKWIINEEEPGEPN